MDADRLFFRVNAVFCFYVGLSLLSKAIGPMQPGASPHDPDRFMDLILRHFAQQSFYFAVLAGYIPALILVSMAVSFYLYLHERSRPVALIAFLLGTTMAGMWIARRYWGTMITTISEKYKTTNTLAQQQDLNNHIGELYYYDSLGSVLSQNTSLVAFALFGFLFLRGSGLEYIVGALFMASSAAMIFVQFWTPSSPIFEAAGVLILPAFAFLLSSWLLWKFRPTVEHWAKDGPPVVVEEA